MTTDHLAHPAPARPARLRASAWATLIAALALAAPASAHHSYGMFDTTKRVTLSGTVREFQWNNPHCFIELLASGAPGAPAEEWGIEMGSPAHLARAGWNRATVKPGDRLTVVIFPLRDGSKGGNYVSAIAADGKPIGSQP